MTDRQKQPALRPRDASTLIILRRGEEPAKTRVLMGKRHAAHKFMPNKFVFPGGRVDPGDGRIAAATELHPVVHGKLLARMRGTPGNQRARGIAMAAVRETFEETGFIIGRPDNGLMRTRSNAWKPFFDTGHLPALSGMRLFARAITPPGRPRRFDTRFLVVDADEVVNLDTPANVGTDELLDPYWLTIDETAELDLPWITGEILRRLKAALEKHNGVPPEMPCTYQRMIGKDWHYEQL